MILLNWRHMSGKMSRNKGRRLEYLVRDLARKAGFQADRVPLSGASQGFKGDVRISKYGKTYIIECKSRSAGFSSIYDLYHQDASGIYVEGRCYRIMTDLEAMIDMRGLYLILKPPVKGLKKLMGLEKLLQGADFLAIKDNNRPILYVRYG